MKRDRDLEKEEKVEHLYVTREMAEDKEMDEKIRRDLIQAADQAEEEFQKEEALGFAGMKIEEKQKLFDDIIGELKKKGIWEEDDEQKEEEQRAEKKKEIPRRDQKEKHQKNENKWEEQKKNQQENEKQKKVAITSKQEEQGKTTVTLSLEEQLSPEDREALRLGRELLQTPQKKHSTTMHKILKGMAGAAIVALGVFVLSMSSEANRLKVLYKWNSLVTDGLRINIATKEKHNYDKDFAEENAYDLIEKELGIKPLKIMYMPTEMSYSDYLINKEDGTASIYYVYKNTVMSINMYKKNSNAKYSQKFDGKIVDSINIYAGLIETKIWLMEDSSEKSYMSEFEYDNAYYTICGSIPEDEFRKIIGAIF